VRRFIGEPSYPVYHPNVGWRVSARCEVRGRGGASSQYYTSILYPLVVEDTLQIAIAAPQGGQLVGLTVDTLDIAVPSLQSGVLGVTISYLSYDGRPWPDTLSVAVPGLQSGTLAVTINYLTYDGRPWPDTLDVPVPTLQSGTLIVTINYVDYSNWVTFNDNTLGVAVPTLQSGTLA